MDIIRPNRVPSHPDYEIECEEALDVPLRDLVDMAIAAGLVPERVFDALASLVEHQRLAYAEDPDPADYTAARAN